MLLTVNHLNKTFAQRGGFFGSNKARVQALCDVSLTLAQGEVLGLVGESGCGKSTLGRCLLKLMEPDSGQIIFDGQDISSWTPAAMRPLRREMQMIFQDPFSSLNPRMTVGATLQEPLLVHKIATRKNVGDHVQELLQLVGLPAEAINRFPHEFSGGQRQRIGIARALSVKPRLIVADEAVSALDISIQAQIINLLSDLREKLKLTMIFIAHDLKVVEHISNRICVMYLGRVMEVFPADQIDQVRHPYTKSLLAAVPIPDPLYPRRPVPLAGEIPSPLAPPSGCVFHTRCPMAQPSCSQKVPKLCSVSDGHQVACDVVKT